MARLLTCDKALEEWLLGQILVVLLEVFLGRGDHLQSNELVSSLLESTDNVADQAALDAVGLDGDEAGLGG